MDVRAKHPGGYWYPGNDQWLEVLRALRRFRAAETDMRSRLKSDMDLNDTDLAALRHLIAAEVDGHDTSPADLARELGITTAATAKLLARLAGSGHIRREPNPCDGRAQLLHPTSSAHEEVQRALRGMHERMRRVAEALTPLEQATVVRFLDAMSAAVDGDPVRSKQRL